MMPPPKDKGAQPTPDGPAVLMEVLKVAGTRPETGASIKEKNQYAVRFANTMAERIASDLHGRLKGIYASPKRGARSAEGPKQLDVNFSPPHLGLALGISLKSVHTRDVGGNHRYTHNMKRNREELLVEASGYHKRQPYAVMVGVLFLPLDSCEDGRGTNPSSFGSWVRKLRPLAGRGEPENEIERFERIFVALYDPDGTHLRFFDVESDPPRNARPPDDDAGRIGPDGRPRRTLSYSEFLDAVHEEYLERNLLKFRWANGDEEILDPEGTDSEDEPT